MLQLSKAHSRRPRSGTKTARIVRKILITTRTRTSLSKSRRFRRNNLQKLAALVWPHMNTSSDNGMNDKNLRKSEFQGPAQPSNGRAKKRTENLQRFRLSTERFSTFRDSDQSDGFASSRLSTASGHRDCILRWLENWKIGLKIGDYKRTNFEISRVSELNEHA